MPVFVAVDHENYPIDVVLAKSKEFATIYWQGKGVTFNSVKLYEDSMLANHPTGVMPVLSTTVLDGYALSGRRNDAKYRLVSKG